MKINTQHLQKGINVVGDFRGDSSGISKMVPAVWKNVGIAFITLSLFLITLALFIVPMITCIVCRNRRQGKENAIPKTKRNNYIKL